MPSASAAGSFEGYSNPATFSFRSQSAMLADSASSIAEGADDPVGDTIDLIGQKVTDIDSFSIKILIVKDVSGLALDIDPPNAFTRLAIMRNVTADAAAKMGPQRTRGGIPESPFRFRPIASAIGADHGVFEGPHHEVFGIEHWASSSSVA